MLRHAQVLKQALQCLRHQRAYVPQFLPRRSSQAAQDVVPLIGDGQLHLPAVCAGARPLYQPPVFTAVYQLDHAVVVELHALGQRADDGSGAFG